MMPTSGVVCVCGKDQVRDRVTHRPENLHGRRPEGLGLGRQRTTFHSDINLCVRAKGPGIPCDIRSECRRRRYLKLFAN